MIIIAFDGMDYELVKEFDLNHIIQDEFGKIDNSTGTKKRMTSELFTSFITGQTWEKHNVTGLNKVEIDDRRIERIENLIGDTKLGQKTTALREAVFENINRIGYTKRRYNKNDYKLGTIFDEIDAAKPLFVPGYNPEVEWVCEMPLIMMKKGYTKEETLEKQKEYTQKRMDEFWDLSHDFWDLIMLHLHDPDNQQHLIKDKERLKKRYQELDKFAKKLLDEFEDEKVVFMSDHGLPEGNSHNKNAFYSSNTELFPDNTPKITDFHSKIINLTTN